MGDLYQFISLANNLNSQSEIFPPYPKVARPSLSGEADLFDPRESDPSTTQRTAQSTLSMLSHKNGHVKQPITHFQTHPYLKINQQFIHN